jgi:hypothetical protein
MSYNISYYLFYHDIMVACLAIVYKYKSILILLIDDNLLINNKFVVIYH